MADWPNLALDSSLVAVAGFASAFDTAPTALTCGASNAKGSWAEWIASTAFEVRSLMITFGPADVTTAHYLVDLGIGAGGSEEVLIPNLHHWSPPNRYEGAHMYFFPLAIPAGTRVALRGQTSNGVALAVRVVIHTFSGGFRDAYSGVESIGVDTTSSQPTLVDPGTTANTKGAWTQLTAATTRHLRALALRIVGNSGTPIESYWRIDLAVGAGGSEQQIVSDLHVSTSVTNGPLRRGTFGPLPVSIPAGTRIAARAQCSHTTTATRQLNIALYGLY